MGFKLCEPKETIVKNG